MDEIDGWDYNVLLARVATQKADDWLANVLEQAMELLRAKNIFDCGLRSAVGTSTGGMFSLARDEGMAALYQKNVNEKFCLPDNYHLHKIHMCTYASRLRLFSEHALFTQCAAPPNHSQNPDSFAVMRFTDVAGDDRTMTVLYEGENHQKNQKFSGDGGWLWSKMFQAMGMCHDIDSSVSGVMITTVMHKHNPLDFTADAQTPHFAHMAASYLRAHVKLLARLLEYNRATTKEQTWIGGRLKDLKAPVTANDHYDFVCTINSDIHGGFKDAHVSSSGEHLLAAAQASEGGEYAAYLTAVQEFYPHLAGHDIQLGARLRAWRTPVFRMNFRAGSQSGRGMNVVIHAVRRAPSDALLPSAAVRPIVGVLYPMHVQELVDHLKAEAPPRDCREPFIRKKPKQDIFDISSESLDGLLGWGLSDEWAFGLQMRNITSIWNLWDLDPAEVQDEVDVTVHANVILAAQNPPLPRTDNILEKLKLKKTYRNGRALSCDTTGYFMFILPLMYMSMAVFRKVSDELQYQTGDTSTKNQWKIFEETFLHERLSRDSGVKTVSKTQGLLFTSKTKSLFSIILKATHDECEEIKFDKTLTVFLEKECGWEDIDRPDSPAMIFKILRTTTLLAAQTLAKQVLSAPPVRYTQILETFPLGLQTEIKYAMGRLASFLFFKASDWDGQEHNSDETDADDEDEEEEEDDL